MLCNRFIYPGCRYIDCLYKILAWLCNKFPHRAVCHAMTRVWSSHDIDTLMLDHRSYSHLKCESLNIILSGVTIRTSVSKMNNNFSQTGSQTNFEVSRVSQISEWLRTPEPGLSHPFYRPGPWPPAALVSLWKFPVSLRKWPSEFAKLTVNLWSNFWVHWRMICWSLAASSWQGPAQPSAGQGAQGQVCPQHPATASSQKPQLWKY